jgi:CRP-like cAMP-binding protein
MSAPIPLEDLLTFLVTTPLFEHLDEGELAELVQVMEVEFPTPRQPVFQAGQPADAWYVVYQGFVDVVGDDGHLLSRFGPRACVGEMAILDGGQRSATVTAGEDVVLLRIPRPAFNDLLRAGHLSAYKIVHRFALVLVARLRANNAHFEGSDPSQLDFDDPTDQ